VQAVIAADVAPGDRQGAEALFRCAITSAVDSRAPVLERRCLLSFQRYLKSVGSNDLDVESRLRELSHLNDLPQRVAEAMRAKQNRVSYGRAALS